MAVHSIRIESDSEWCAVEIRSAATWARAPGRALRYGATGAPAEATTVVIDDRAIRLAQRPGAGAQLCLVVQLATSDDRVSLHTDKSRDGSLRLTSAVSARINDGGADKNPLDLLLFLDAAAAHSAGASGGDPVLL